jgi:hypothetical protein
MVNLLMDIELYYWFIERAALEDDPRNEVI